MYNKRKKPPWRREEDKMKFRKKQLFSDMEEAECPCGDSARYEFWRALNFSRHTLRLILSFPIVACRVEFDKLLLIRMDGSDRTVRWTRSRREARRRQLARANALAAPTKQEWEARLQRIWEKHHADTEGEQKRSADDPAEV